MKSISGILLLSLVFISNPILCQFRDISKKKPDTLQKKWNEYKGNKVYFLFGGALFLDTQRYRQDDESVAQVGSLTKFEHATVRAVRFVTLLDLNFGKNTHFDFYFDFGFRGFDQGFERGKDPEWSLYNFELSYFIPRIAKITVGMMKEPNSMERITGGGNLPFIERTAGINALMPSRNDGIRLSNTFLRNRIHAAIGFYNSWITQKVMFSEGTQQFVGRVSGLAIDNKNTSHLLHFGVYGRYSNARTGWTRFRASPEAYFAYDYIDTDTLTINGITWAGFEASWRKGPVWIGMEYAQNWANSPEFNNPNFYTYQVFVDWLITGESRPYLRNQGVFKQARPKKPVTKGGWGMFELGLRYTRTDLTSKLVDGGNLDQGSIALSWYAAESTRILLHYGLARLDRFELTGWTNMFLIRFQIMLL